MKIRVVFVLLCVCLLLGCRKNDYTKLMLNGSALGTYYNIIVYVSDSSRLNFDTLFLRQGIDSVLLYVSSLASIYDSNSYISKFNNNIIDTLHEELMLIMQCALEVHNLSGGYFDVTVAPLVEAWGFKRRDYREPSEQVLDSIRQFVGMHLLMFENANILKKLDPRIRVDLNAIAKGYAVDKVAEWLEHQGIERYLVEIGGEVRVGKHKPDGSKWVIAIEKPAHDALSPQEEYQRIHVEQISVATSGTYRNYFEKDGQRYSHTIDPTTGLPVTHNMLSATVLAKTCMYADALATACMAMGPEKALKMCNQLKNVECYFILADSAGNFRVLQTENLQRYFKP